MTKINRWIDELPEHSPDRVLLGAGRSARPPKGSKEAAWQAITLSLGTAATMTTLSAQASSELATHAIAGNAAVAAQASTAKAVAGATGLSLGVKSVAIGFAIGMGLLGVGEVADRGTEQAPAASVSRVELPTTEAASQHPLSQTFTSQPGAVEPTAIPSSETIPEARQHASALSKPRPAESDIEQSEPAPTGRVSHSARIAPPNAIVAAPNQQSLPTAKAPGLAEQARELAHIQRMLDAGASAEAIRQLEASMGSDPQSGLAEERDALYVQALVKAQRTTQATTWARRFLQRYPSSPHLEKMRRIVSAE